MNDSTNTISNEDKAKMQADASAPEAKPAPQKQPVAKKAAPAPQPPKPKTAAPAKKDDKPAAPKAPAAKVDNTPTIARLAFSVQIVLDLTGTNAVPDELAKSVKTDLTKFKDPVSGVAHNLFNPFRAVTAKAKAADPEAARGIVRNALTTIFDVAADLEGQNVTLLGPRSQVVKNLEQAAEMFGQRVQNAIGINPDTVVYENVERVAPDSDELRTVHRILFSDLVSVRSWANTANLDATQDTGSLMANIAVNIKINALHLDTVTELDNAITQIANFLRNQIEKYGDAPPTMLILSMRPNAVGDLRHLEMLNAFAGEDSDWNVFDAGELAEQVADGNIEWLPTIDKIDTHFLAPGGDLVLLAVLNNDEDNEEEESAEDSED